MCWFVRKDIYFYYSNFWFVLVFVCVFSYKIFYLVGTKIGRQTDTYTNAKENERDRKDYIYSE